MLNIKKTKVISTSMLIEFIIIYGFQGLEKYEQSLNHRRKAVTNVGRIRLFL